MTLPIQPTQSSDDSVVLPPVDPALDPQVALLRLWQSARLTRTYADLLEHKHFRPACLFFLSDIYAPRDFTERDHEIERIYAALQHRAPAHITELFHDLMTLNHLSYALDGLLVHALFEQQGVTDTITEELYAAGYRLCANYQERLHQIDVIADVINRVGVVAHLPFIGTALKVLKGVAYQAGWAELYDFTIRGYEAFRQMRDVKTFVMFVQTRERQILNQIFADCADPFNVSDAPCPDAASLAEESASKP